jgi:hypothetical protein
MLLVVVMTRATAIKFDATIIACMQWDVDKEKKKMQMVERLWPPTPATTSQEPDACQVSWQLLFKV